MGREPVLGGGLLWSSGTVPSGAVTHSGARRYLRFRICLLMVAFVEDVLRQLLERYSRLCVRCGRQKIELARRHAQTYDLTPEIRGDNRGKNFSG